jgi:hypothetical protein
VVVPQSLILQSKCSDCVLSSLSAAPVTSMCGSASVCHLAASFEASRILLCMSSPVCSGTWRSLMASLVSYPDASPVAAT